MQHFNKAEANGWETVGGKRESNGKKSEIQEGAPTTIVKSAFTIDCPGSKRKDDAITIEECPFQYGHHGCNMIGIHVTAVADETSGVPPTYRGKHLDWETTRVWSLNKDEERKVVSVYYHTFDKSTSGPKLTSIEIENNYFCDDTTGIAKEVKTLWSAFIGENHSHMLRGLNFAYIAQNPKGGELFLLLDEIASVFTKVVTEYARQQKSVNFFTKNPSHEHGMQEEADVLVPDELLTKVSKLFQRKHLNKEDEDVFSPVLLASAGMLCQMPINEEVTYFQKKYETAVHEGPKIPAKNVVKCTSPLRSFTDFRNQQILISCLQSRTLYYSKHNLLEQLVIRFRKPTLEKPIVRAITKMSVRLYYPVWESTNIDKNLRELKFKDLSDVDPDFPVEGGTAKIRLKHIWCEDYCNKKMVKLTAADFNSFFSSYRKGSDSKFSQEIKRFEAMFRTKQEQDLTYENEGKDTLLYLQKCTELQIQISNSEATVNPEMGWRLLRIGKDCHFCFTHIHHPEMAFMSDRKDVRKLIGEETIKALKGRKVEEMLSSRRLFLVDIAWSGNYQSGGSFTSTDRNINKHDLLCIRKEIEKNGEVEYVWTCHAVVSKTQIVENNYVTFSTCTLSQNVKRPGSDGYFVEVIKRERGEDGGN